MLVKPRDVSRVTGDDPLAALPGHDDDDGCVTIPDVPLTWPLRHFLVGALDR